MKDKPMEFSPLGEQYAHQVGNMPRQVIYKQ